LLAEIAAKEEEKRKKAEAKRLAKEKREALILREPAEIFGDDKYKKFKIGEVDEQGIPTHDTEGEEFNKKIRGKFEKDYAKHVKQRDALLAKKAKEAENAQ
jgi:cysteinyl-tRNA synthetase